VALTLSSVQPNSAPSGTEVRLIGTGFKPGATVSMGGLTPATVLALSDTQIVAIAPDHTPGKADVVVTNPDQHAATLAGGFTLVFLDLEILEIKVIFPGAGYPNLFFDIHGTGFLKGARVTVGGQNAPLQYNSSSTFIQAVAPPHAIGPADVTVTNPGGASVTVPGGFTYFPLPVLTVAPTVVAPGGQLNVSWVNSILGGSDDGIGLFLVGDIDYNYYDFKNANGPSGTLSFTAPALPGLYEFRFLPYGRLVDLGQSAVVTVTHGGTVLAPTHQSSGRTR
jgi:hypothetical protein